MDTTEFIERLSDGGKHQITKRYDLIGITISIAEKDLHHNIEMLARQLHMDVETNAENAAKLNEARKYQPIGTGLEFEDIDKTETFDIEPKWKNI